MLSVNVYKVYQEKVCEGRLESTIVKSPDIAYQAIKNILQLEREVSEHFGILSLNVKNAIIGIHVLSIGTLNASIVHPRNVFQAAILNNAASIICFHNHPSGNVTPSMEDIQITQRLVECGNIMGIEVLDHIIIGENKYASLKEGGYIA